MKNIKRFLFLALAFCCVAYLPILAGQIILKSSPAGVEIQEVTTNTVSISLASLRQQRDALTEQLARLEVRYTADKADLTKAIARLNSILDQAKGMGITDTPAKETPK